MAEVFLDLVMQKVLLDKCHGEHFISAVDFDEAVVLQCDACRLQDAKQNLLQPRVPYLVKCVIELSSNIV